MDGPGHGLGGGQGGQPGGGDAPGLVRGPGAGPVRGRGRGGVARGRVLHGDGHDRPGREPVVVGPGSGVREPGRLVPDVVVRGRGHGHGLGRVPVRRREGQGRLVPGRGPHVHAQGPAGPARGHGRVHGHGHGAGGFGGQGHGVHGLRGLGHGQGPRGEGQAPGVRVRQGEGQLGSRGGSWVAGPEDRVRQGHGVILGVRVRARGHGHGLGRVPGRIREYRGGRGIHGHGRVIARDLQPDGAGGFRGQGHRVGRDRAFAQVPGRGQGAGVGQARGLGIGHRGPEGDAGPLVVGPGREVGQGGGRVRAVRVPHRGGRDRSGRGPGARRERQGPGLRGGVPVHGHGIVVAGHGEGHVARGPRAQGHRVDRGPGRGVAFGQGQIRPVLPRGARVRVQDQAPAVAVRGRDGKPGRDPGVVPAPGHVRERGHVLRGVGVGHRGQDGLGRGPGGRGEQQAAGVGTRVPVHGHGVLAAGHGHGHLGRGLRGQGQGVDLHRGRAGRDGLHQAQGARVRLGRARVRVQDEGRGVRVGDGDGHGRLGRGGQGPVPGRGVRQPDPVVRGVGVRGRGDGHGLGSGPGGGVKEQGVLVAGLGVRVRGDAGRDAADGHGHRSPGIRVQFYGVARRGPFGHGQGGRHHPQAGRFVVRHGHGHGPGRDPGVIRAGHRVRQGHGLVGVVPVRGRGHGHGFGHGPVGGVKGQGVLVAGGRGHVRGHAAPHAAHGDGHGAGGLRGQSHVIRGPAGFGHGQGGRAQGHAPRVVVGHGQGEGPGHGPVVGPGPGMGQGPGVGLPVVVLGRGGLHGPGRAPVGGGEPEGGLHPGLGVGVHGEARVRGEGHDHGARGFRGQPHGVRPGVGRVRVVFGQDQGARVRGDGRAGVRVQDQGRGLVVGHGHAQGGHAHHGVVAHRAGGQGLRQGHGRHVRGVVVLRAAHGHGPGRVPVRGGKGQGGRGQADLRGRGFRDRGGDRDGAGGFRGQGHGIGLGPAFGHGQVVGLRGGRRARVRVHDHARGLLVGHGHGQGPGHGLVVRPKPKVGQGRGLGPAVVILGRGDGDGPGRGPVRGREGEGQRGHGDARVRGDAHGDGAGGFRGQGHGVRPGVGRVIDVFGQGQGTRVRGGRAGVRVQDQGRGLVVGHGHVQVRHADPGVVALGVRGQGLRQGHGRDVRGIVVVRAAHGHGLGRVPVRGGEGQGRRGQADLRGRGLRDRRGDRDGPGGFRGQGHGVDLGPAFGHGQVVGLRGGRRAQVGVHDHPGGVVVGHGHGHRGRGQGEAGGVARGHVRPGHGGADHGLVVPGVVVPAGNHGHGLRHGPICVQKAQDRGPGRGGRAGRAQGDVGGRRGGHADFQVAARHGPVQDQGVDAHVGVRLARVFGQGQGGRGDARARGRGHRQGVAGQILGPGVDRGRDPHGHGGPAAGFARVAQGQPGRAVPGPASGDRGDGQGGHVRDQGEVGRGDAARVGLAGQGDGQDRAVQVGLGQGRGREGRGIRGHRQGVAGQDAVAGVGRGRDPHGHGRAGAGGDGAGVAQAHEDFGGRDPRDGGLGQVRNGGDEGDVSRHDGGGKGAALQGQGQGRPVQGPFGQGRQVGQGDRGRGHGQGPGLQIRLAGVGRGRDPHGQGGQAADGAGEGQGQGRLRGRAPGDRGDAQVGNLRNQGEVARGEGGRKGGVFQGQGQRGPVQGLFGEPDRGGRQGHALGRRHGQGRAGQGRAPGMGRGPHPHGQNLQPVNVHVPGRVREGQGQLGFGGRAPGDAGQAHVLDGRDQAEVGRGKRVAEGAALQGDGHAGLIQRGLGQRGRAAQRGPRAGDGDPEEEVVRVAVRAVVVRVVHDDVDDAVRGGVPGAPADGARLGAGAGAGIRLGAAVRVKAQPGRQADDGVAQGAVAAGARGELERGNGHVPGVGLIQDHGGAEGGHGFDGGHGHRGRVQVQTPGRVAPGQDRHAQGLRQVNVAGERIQGDAGLGAFGVDDDEPRDGQVRDAPEHDVAQVDAAAEGGPDQGHGQGRGRALQARLRQGTRGGREDRGPHHGHGEGQGLFVGLGPVRVRVPDCVGDGVGAGRGGRAAHQPRHGPRAGAGIRLGAAVRVKAQPGRQPAQGVLQGPVAAGGPGKLHRGNGLVLQVGRGRDRGMGEGRGRVGFGRGGHVDRGGDQVRVAVMGRGRDAHGQVLGRVQDAAGGQGQGDPVVAGHDRGLGEDEEIRDGGLQAEVGEADVAAEGGAGQDHVQLGHVQHGPGQRGRAGLGECGPGGPDAQGEGQVAPVGRGAVGVGVLGRQGDGVGARVGGGAADLQRGGPRAGAGDLCGAAGGVEGQARGQAGQGITQGPVAARGRGHGEGGDRGALDQGAARAGAGERGGHVGRVGGAGLRGRPDRDGVGGQGPVAAVDGVGDQHGQGPVPGQAPAVGQGQGRRGVSRLHRGHLGDGQIRDGRQQGEVGRGGRPGEGGASHQGHGHGGPVERGRGQGPVGRQRGPVDFDGEVAGKVRVPELRQGVAVKYGDVDGEGPGQSGGAADGQRGGPGTAARAGGVKDQPGRETPEPPPGRAIDPGGSVPVHEGPVAPRGRGHREGHDGLALDGDVVRNPLRPPTGIDSEGGDRVAFIQDVDGLGLQVPVPEVGPGQEAELQGVIAGQGPTEAELDLHPAGALLPRVLDGQPGQRGIRHHLKPIPPESELPIHSRRVDRQTGPAQSDLDPAVIQVVPEKAPGGLDPEGGRIVVVHGHGHAPQGGQRGVFDGPPQGVRQPRGEVNGVLVLGRQHGHGLGRGPGRRGERHLPDERREVGVHFDGRVGAAHGEGHGTGGLGRQDHGVVPYVGKGAAPGIGVFFQGQGSRANRHRGLVVVGQRQGQGSGMIRGALHPGRHAQDFVRDVHVVDRPGERHLAPARGLADRDGQQGPGLGVVGLGGRGHGRGRDGQHLPERGRVIQDRGDGADAPFGQRGRARGQHHPGGFVVGHFQGDGGVRDAAQGVGHGPAQGDALGLGFDEVVHGPENDGVGPGPLQGGNGQAARTHREVARVRRRADGEVQGGRDRRGPVQARGERAHAPVLGNPGRGQGQGHPRGRVVVLHDHLLGIGLVVVRGIRAAGRERDGGPGGPVSDGVVHLPEGQPLGRPPGRGGESQGRRGEGELRGVHPAGGHGHGGRRRGDQARGERLFILQVQRPYGGQEARGAFPQGYWKVGEDQAFRNLPINRDRPSGERHIRAGAHCVAVFHGYPYIEIRGER